MSRGRSWFSNTTTEEALLASSVFELGPAAWQKAFRSFQNLHDFLASSELDKKAAGFTDKQIKALKGGKHDLSSIVKVLERGTISLVTIDDDSYPSLLKEINDPPLWLFYRGALEALKLPTLTVVGTRKPTAYAEEVVKILLIPELLKNICVVSGLAYGIDKLAHQQSLSADSATVAVLAGGLDKIYPADHTKLAEEIVERGGALISEYPPGSKPEAFRFPIRNRIVAGLSDVTLVIEAGIKSGTLTTARSAIDYNRDVMAVPGEITRASSEGSNYLLKQGAILIDSPDQLLEYFGIQAVEELPTIDKPANELLDLLLETPRTIDALVNMTKLPIEEVLTKLTELELGGLVYQTVGGEYHLKKR